MAIKWQLLPSSLNFREHEVHLIRVFIPEASKNYETYWNYLNETEKSKANRYYFEKDRVQYVCSKGILRQLLAAFLNKEPHQISFVLNAHGKEFLPAKDNFLNLEFNLSHSYQCIVYAFTLKHILGVDVEYPRDLDYEGMAQRFFSKKEQEQLLSLNPKEKCSGFYYGWTRKEAFIKALGTGLSHPLDSFSVCLLPQQEVRFLDIDHKENAINEWTLHDFLSYPNYFAAFATKQKVQEVYYWEVISGFTHKY